MDDHVESFGKINQHGHRSVRGSGLVKAPTDLVGEGEEGSGGGPVRTETMLSGGDWEVAVEFWKRLQFVLSKFGIDIFDSLETMRFSAA